MHEWWHFIKFYSRQVCETVSWLFSEPMIYYYIKLLLKSWWPNGKLTTAPSPRTEKEKLSTRYGNIGIQLRLKVCDSGTLI
jgi:hypothetical protein